MIGSVCEMKENRENKTSNSLIPTSKQSKKKPCGDLQVLVESLKNKDKRYRQSSPILWIMSTES